MPPKKKKKAPPKKKSTSTLVAAAAPRAASAPAARPTPAAAARGTIGNYYFGNGPTAAPAEDATQPSVKKKTKAKSVPIKGHPLSGLTPPSIVQ